MWRFWLWRGYFAEGRRWLEAALAGASTPGSPEEQRARAWALAGAGNLAMVQGSLEAARARMEESVPLFRTVGDQRGLAIALRILAEGLLYGGADAGQVQSLLEESLGLARAAGEERGVAYALFYLGLLAVRERDDSGARQLLTEALALFRQIGDATSTSGAVWMQGVLAMVRGDLPGARQNLEEALVSARRLGNKPFVGVNLLMQGCLAHLEGDRGRARGLLAESVRLLRETGTPGIHAVLGYLGFAAIARGRSAWGVRLLAFAVAGPPEYNELSVVLPSALKSERDQRLAVARAALGEEAFAAAWAEGQAMTPEQALEYALAEGAD
jgi:tetratricopeptide (TPR) repeat protein